MDYWGAACMKLSSHDKIIVCFMGAWTIIGAVIIMYSLISLGPIETSSIHLQGTWHGADVQVFQNFTITSHGFTQSFIVNCDYFHDGQVIKTVFNPHGSITLGPAIGIMNLPTGCRIQ